MKYSRLLSAVSVIVLGNLWAACSSVLAPVPDNTRYFVLTANPQPAATTPTRGSSAGLVVGLGPISLPGYLDRPQVATRVNPNRLDYAENDLWAQPLSANFTQVLGQDLTQLVGASQIVNYPWYSSQPVDYAVEVQAAHFECTQGGDCQLDADWSISNPRGGKVLRRQQSNLAVQAGGDASANAAALSQVLYQMSQQIAGAIEQLAATRVATSS